MKRGHSGVRGLGDFGVRVLGHFGVRVLAALGVIVLGDFGVRVVAIFVRSGGITPLPQYEELQTFNNSTLNYSLALPSIL